jgi:hypothetical protein
VTGPRRRTARLLRPLVLGAAALLGDHAGTLVSDQWRTIAVPVFANETKRHDLEWELTRAVVEELQARTDLRVVPESDGPDLVLRGVLRDADEDTLSKRDFQRIREGAYFVTAEVDVLDRRTQTSVVKDRKVHEREAYVPGIAEDVRTARAEATRALAERIVRTLEESW